MAKEEGWAGAKTHKDRDAASNGTLEGLLRDFAAGGDKGQAASVLAGITRARDARRDALAKAAKGKGKGEGMTLFDSDAQDMWEDLLALYRTATAALCAACSQLAKEEGWAGDKTNKDRKVASDRTLKGLLRDFAAGGDKGRAASVLAGITRARDARRDSLANAAKAKGRAKPRGKAKAKAKAKAKGKGKAKGKAKAKAKGKEN